MGKGGISPMAVVILKNTVVLSSVNELCVCVCEKGELCGT